MAVTYTPIATTTLESSQSSVTFSSLGSYTDIVLVVGGTASGDCAMTFRFNGDSGSNYSATYMYNDASAKQSGRTNGQTIITSMGRLNTTGGTSVINIMSHSNASKYKTVIGRGSTAASLVITTVGLWRSTAAISSILIGLEGSNTFSAGTTLTLYGILAAA